MKKIASLMLASICLLAFVEPPQASSPSWGQWEVEHSAAVQRADRRPDLLSFAEIAGPTACNASVASINIDPKTTKVPGVLANIWPKLKDALNAVRNALGTDPTLKASLDVHGLRPESVLGAGQAPDGQLAVIVSNHA
jgi:hypothetical protein